MRPLVVGLAMMLVGCMPVTSAYLTLPVEPIDAAGVELAVLRLPIAELRRLLQSPDAQQFTVYAGGRTPLPHRLIDSDKDGVVDTLVVKLPVPPAGITLAIVTPGPTTEGDVPAGGTEAAVRVRFDRAGQ